MHFHSAWREQAMRTAKIAITEDYREQKRRRRRPAFFGRLSENLVVV